MNKKYVVYVSFVVDAKNEDKAFDKVSDAVARSPILNKYPFSGGNATEELKE